MRHDRYSRRLKWWWQAADTYNMRPQEDSMDVDTQPLPVEEGFLDFNAPDWKPMDVRVERPDPVAVLAELMRAVEDERKGLH